jgi:hypothetical protein
MVIAIDHNFEFWTHPSLPSSEGGIKCEGDLSDEVDA